VFFNAKTSAILYGEFKCAEVFKIMLSGNFKPSGPQNHVHNTHLFYDVKKIGKS